MCGCSKVNARLSCDECNYSIGAIEDGSGIPCDCLEHNPLAPNGHPHDCCCINCYARQLLEVEEDELETVRQQALAAVENIPTAKTLYRWFSWNSLLRFEL